MRILIAIMTCNKYPDRRDVLRSTWIPAVHGADVRFFAGRGAPAESDLVLLDCEDDYKSLRRKVQAMFAWAAGKGYDYVFKTDDDVLVLPQRLLARKVFSDYIGRVRGPSHENDGPRIYGPGERSFCSGFGYWLSRRAAAIVGAAPDNGDWAEDRFTGNILARYNILPVHDNGILLWPPLMGHFCTYPNPRCPACHQQYLHASVICPHERLDAVKQLYDYFLSTGFIPTELGPTPQSCLATS